MADNKQYFQWLDIPNQQGGNDRKWAKDAEAQAGIAQVASAIGFDTDYEFVDLGLPSGTLWAKCNVGATTETGYGNYYMYGKGSSQYNSSDTAYTGGEEPLDLTKDTARQVMGDAWYMPTKAQIDELIANTTYTWVTNFNGSGINGGKFTAANGNYIFIPAAGNYSGSNLEDVGNEGYIFGSTPYGGSNAYGLKIKSGDKISTMYSRTNGFSIRGVISGTDIHLINVKDELSDKADKSELPTFATTAECRAIVTGYNS